MVLFTIPVSLYASKGTTWHTLQTSPMGLVLLPLAHGISGDQACSGVLSSGQGDLSVDQTLQKKQRLGL